MEFFKKPGGGGVLLSSKPLENLVCATTSALAEHSREYGTTTVESWRDGFDKVLLLVRPRHHTLRLATEFAEKDDEILLTCMGVSVLAEYLTKATSLCIKIKVKTTVPQKSRISNFKWPCDCADTQIDEAPGMVSTRY